MNVCVLQRASRFFYPDIKAAIWRFQQTEGQFWIGHHECVVSMWFWFYFTETSTVRYDYLCGHFEALSDWIALYWKELLLFCLPGVCLCHILSFPSSCACEVDKHMRILWPISRQKNDFLIFTLLRKAIINIYLRQGFDMMPVHKVQQKTSSVPPLWSVCWIFGSYINIKIPSFFFPLKAPRLLQTSHAHLEKEIAGRFVRLLYRSLWPEFSG